MIVFAGDEDGNGCSRDYAANRPKRLGLRAMIARSFARIHRVAISNQWLAALDERGVTFRLRALDAREFMRRFLLHVLRPGTHRIRNYGLLDNTVRRANIARVSIYCISCSTRTQLDDAVRHAFICQHCRSLMIVIDVIERSAPIRAPPVQRASAMVSV